MSNEVINQAPSVERAKELEQQAKEGLKQLKAGQERAITACHKMRDTKAYSALGFDSYYAWGESTLNLKKSRLNELALAGEVQQELLTGVAGNIQIPDTPDTFEPPNVPENNIPAADFSEPEPEDEANKEQASGSLSDQLIKPIFSSSELSDISTPQLVALAKAPKGERLAVLDKAADEAKAEDKPITTSIIKDAVKASVKPVEPSADEKAAAIKKHHRSAMGKVSKLGETLRGLDTTHVSSEDVASWKTYLDDVKESILVLEKARRNRSKPLDFGINVWVFWSWLSFSGNQILVAHCELAFWLLK
ncbi:hypothetical protein BHECKSOX_1, partial [Bathymodiolus heckerae thiotrophic gill symbiont]|uniref:hypothetical protein n=1 Tax=Bathymodiolus heckerae thiotrophic gill symbiont TaxID=1052212 RepID=UPI0010BBF796